MSDDALLTFFKSLADANRLRIVGLLAHRPHTVEELAEVLSLRPSTVSHHLSKLSGAALVSARADGHYHQYALDIDALEARARSLLSADELRELAPVDDDVDPYERKVLAAFLDDEGRLKAQPMKRKKFEVILRHVLRTQFPDEGPWTELEVNRRLRVFSDDVATLRRGFIDHRLMTRQPGGTAYARAE
jgi:hypothetical protein